MVNPVGWWLREDDMMKATKLSLHHLRLAPGRAPSPLFSTDVSLGVADCYSSWSFRETGSILDKIVKGVHSFPNTGRATTAVSWRHGNVKCPGPFS